MGSQGEGLNDVNSIQPGEYVLAFAKFIEEYYCISVESLLEAPGEHEHHAMDIDAQILIEANMALGTLLLTHPATLFPLFNDAIRVVQQKILPKKQQDAGPLASNGHATFTLKPNVHARLIYLPPVEEVTKPNISSIRSSDVNRLLQISGTVIRTGMIKMLEAEKEYECTNSKCGFRFKVFSDVEQGNLMEVPRACPSSAGSSKCKSTSFQFVEGSTVTSDYQEIKIQEQVQKLTVGSIPRSVVVVLQNDLVDSVKAGDDVVISGILLRRWKPSYRDVRCELESILLANSIRINKNTKTQANITDELRHDFEQFWRRMESNPLLGRNHILSSVCPQIYGLFMVDPGHFASSSSAQVKLAVTLTLIGGCGYSDSSGMKVRAQPHLLIIGDPGTGKSQFLRFAAQVSPRSVLTTGVGTTSAGLTCTAVKDSGEWMLEAGALVLADRGVCCIDEFNSIREHDRSTIHEAMEQQTLSVAKAGLVCKLNARTTIIATTNPKGKYDLDADVSVNTAIASPLLSRFDIVLVLLDTVNPTWDNVVSSFILEQTSKPSPLSQMASQVSRADREEPWSLSKLQAYIYWVKEEFQPTLSSAAQQILSKYYQLQRQSDQRNSARTTIRLLESTVRVAQAHARLMCRREAGVQDAVVAVTLMEASVSSSSMLNIDSILHSDFVDDPDTDYYIQEDIVLKELRLRELSTRRGGPSFPPPSQGPNPPFSQREKENERANGFVQSSQGPSHYQPSNHSQSSLSQLSGASSRLSRNERVDSGWARPGPFRGETRSAQDASQQEGGGTPAVKRPRRTREEILFNMRSRG